MSPKFRIPFLVLVLAVCGLVSAAPGCKSGPRLLSVKGHVTVDGKPLETGYVTYKPDKSKGNTFGADATATIGTGGEYTLTTNGQPGAPAGAYKVIVNAYQGSGDPMDNTNVSKMKPLVNQKYFDPDKTPLEKEVVASPSPNAYDLEVTR
jgi:hypothetical protein